jgi:phage baseplate assembly protein W
MRGMDRHTGKPLEGRAHLLQSIGDITTTPLRTRVMRRDYGLDDTLIDRPATTQSFGMWAFAVADALDRALETRYQINSVKVYRVDSLGRCHLRLIGVDNEGGGDFDMDGLVF